MEETKLRIIDHLQKNGQAIIDARLWLDTHPNHLKVLQEAQELVRRQRLLYRSLQQEGFTLQNFSDHPPSTTSSWLFDPWPWEMG
nr:hypothetical protein [Bacilli bacterium]